MRLPVAPLKQPAVLLGKANGHLPAAVLRRVRGAGADVLLVTPAADAWEAMVADAAANGITLKVATLSRSYRPYTEQETIFRARHYPSVFGTRWWNGKRWRKRSGVAAAAVPGTSNHGWGLAVDIGEELDGDAGTESISNRAVQWLIDNAHRFGFSAEIQSEKWHWRYVTGDNTPAAVTAFHTTPDPTPAPGTGGSARMMIAYGWFVWLNEGWRYRLITSPDSVAALKKGGVPFVDLTNEPATLKALLNEAAVAGRLKQNSAGDLLLAQLNEG